MSFAIVSRALRRTRSSVLSGHAVLVVLSGLLLVPAVARSESAAAPRQFRVASIDAKAPAIAQNGRKAEAIRRSLKRAKLPPGFQIELFALVPDARRLAVSHAYDGLFVGTRKSTLWVITIPEGESMPDEIRPFAPSLRFKAPEGLCFTADGFLVVVEQNRILAMSTMEFFEGGPEARVVETVPQGQLIPASDQPLQDTVRACTVGRDMKLYVALGQSGGQAPRDSRAATGSIVRLNPFDGRRREVYASGICSPGGMVFNPNDNTLWFTTPRADDGSPSTGTAGFSRVTTAGQSFGCASSSDETAATKARSAGQGLLFYAGSQFPQPYRGGVFAVQVGLRSGQTDTRLTFTPVGKDGAPGETNVFAEGWSDGSRSGLRGRLVDVAQTVDGTLLVSDELAGAIYKITYVGQ